MRRGSSVSSISFQENINISFFKNSYPIIQGLNLRNRYSISETTKTPQSLEVNGIKYNLTRNDRQGIQYLTPVITDNQNIVSNTNLTNRIKVNFTDGTSLQGISGPTVSTRSTIFNLQSLLSGSAILRNILDRSIEGNQVSLEFLGEDQLTYKESIRDIEPLIYSAVYEADVALQQADIPDDFVALLPDDDTTTAVFRVTQETFTKIKGQDSGKFYYYKKTINNPLLVNPAVYSFINPVDRLKFRWVAIQTTLREADLLRARVYKYKCRYKWLDSRGIEHHSQWSDEIQLFSQEDIGEAGNRPTFELNNLHLTNKEDASLSIEVYRTEKNLDTFQFLKEVRNNRDNEKTIITDDVLDRELGAVAGPNNLLISGARFCTSYKGRYVLYGFPDKKNRIIISSPIRNFTNQAIDFRNEGTAGDMIELLMEDEVKSVKNMDQFLVIFTTKETYAWSVNETSGQQQFPTPITGLVNLSAKDAVSSEKVSDGILFLSDKGIWLASRGLSGEYIGKDVQDFKGNIKEITNVSDADETRILTDDPDHPILVYNYRFKRWSIFDNLNVVSTTLWKGKYMALTRDNKILEENENVDVLSPFIFETGWIQFEAIQNFQRFREIFLLGNFRGLTALTMEFFYDFSDQSSETINYDLSRYSTAPPDLITSDPIIKPVDSIKQFRFQPRRQKCSSVKVRCKIQSFACELTGLRLGYLKLPGSYIRSSKV